MHYFEIVNKDYSKRVRIGAVLLLAVITVIISISSHDNELILTVLRTINVGCIWIVSDSLKSITVPWQLQITFFVYMTHAEIQKCLNKLFEIALPAQGNVYAVINTIVGAIATYGLILFASLILSKWLPHIWRIINGGRVLYEK